VHHEPVRAPAWTGDQEMTKWIVMIIVLAVIVGVCDFLIVKAVLS
jgi:preprotein translocase subunit SecE